MSSTSDRRKTVKVTNSSCEEGGDTEIARDPDWEDLIASSDSESTDIDECVELNESDEDYDYFSESDYDSDEESTNIAQYVRQFHHRQYMSVLF